MSCMTQPGGNGPARSVDPGTSFDKKIDSIIRSMTLEEKIRMLHGNGKFFSPGVPSAGISDFQYTDGPLGIREEISRDSWNPLGWTTDSATFFPASSALAATWNRELAHEYGSAMGSEARARNKDILLAPAVNIIRTPLCGRNYEYFSEDPFLIAEMALPMVKGVQEQDVAACVKHYAINNQETNRNSIDVIAGERAIREIYLPAFRAAVEEGRCLVIMGAYNRFRGTYLCENDYMLNRILKGEWGFLGAVISDWGAVHSTEASAKAGLDVEMGTEMSYEKWFFSKALLEAVRAGKVEEKVIDDKVRRLLRIAFAIRKDQPGRQKGSINTPEHSETAYRVASEAIVLLKNSEGLLPLDIRRMKNIAVIGENAVQTFASGGFGAGVKARYETTFLQAMKNRLANQADISFARGYKEHYVPGINDHQPHGRLVDQAPDPALMAEAMKTAAAADCAVVVIGTNRHVDSEGADRRDIRLPFGQEELLKAVKQANPNTVAVIVAGGPFDLTEVEKNTSAIVWTWFNGSEGGTALADVILGGVNPSGKLPYTIPKKLEDSPAHALNAFPGDSVKVEYLEDILVGYRWFDTKNIDPAYCFGHGLSYTTFEISGIQTDKPEYRKDGQIKLSCKVRNTGSRAGAEVVQIYARDPETKVIKAYKELKGFEKVELLPGEEKTVTITIPVKDLARYDESSGGWVVDKGEYRLLVGTSSREIKGEAGLEVR